ncbi:MAG TPA: twin-arginine translocase TatA/TatE family subunit [Gaiellaceae bacterium]|nr:twin-arginine translocase TatA/TatE family subunit [Gaiellaceae bacterium]
MSSLIGPWGIVILVVILFLVYGPKRLSTMGRSFGKGKREFMHSISRNGEDGRPRELPAATGQAPKEPASADSERSAD